MFWIKRKQIKPEKILEEAKEIQESVITHTIPAPLYEPVMLEEPKIENDRAIPFVTINGSLVFSLQDKFNVTNVYFDKNNGGIKTYVFDATEKEVKDYLGR
jgi:hypothetical protein